MLVRGENMLVTYDILKESLSNYKAPEMKIKRMTDNGEIIRLTKNLYETEINTAGRLVANAIYSPSYLSFDYALAYHGLIPEAVYIYTSATYNKRKKKKYTNALGTFTYRDVPSQVYPYGINIYNDGAYSFAIASPEKALCDKLYTLKPLKNQKQISELLFEDLRIDYNSFQKLNFTDLKILCGLYKNTNMKILEKVIGDFNEDDTRTNGR